MPVKYAQERRTALTEAEVAALSAKALEDDGEVSSLLVEGRCPTCKHGTRQVVPVAVIAEVDTPLTKSVSIDKPTVKTLEYNVGTKLRVNATGEKIRPIVVSCRCASDHPSANGKFGCGRSWMLRITFYPSDPSRAVVLSRPTTEDLAYWSSIVAMDETTANPVKSVRESGDKWQKALAGILALVGLTAAVGGRDALAKMASPWPAIISIAVAAVLLGSAVALFLAHQAAIGFPTFRSMSTREDLDAYASDPLAQAASAVERLQSAATVAAITFILAVGTLLMIWNAPAKSTPATSVKISFTNGDSWCAKLLDPAKPTEVRIRPADGTARNRAAAEITGLAPGGAC